MTRGCSGESERDVFAMSSKVANADALSHRQRLENVTPVMAKADLKNLEIEWKRRVGRAVSRAFKRADLSQKEVAGLLNHSDSAQINRWCAGTERPQLDALFAIDALQQPLVIELARMINQGVKLTTHIELELTA